MRGPGASARGGPSLDRKIGLPLMLDLFENHASLFRVIMPASATLIQSSQNCDFKRYISLTSHLYARAVKQLTLFCNLHI